MKLFDTIKSWFNSADKDRLDHFDIERIETVINSIKDAPLLKFMQDQIEPLLQNITISSKDNRGTERKFIVINGVGGSGKTYLVYQLLKNFLLATGVIKKDQEPINKIASHDLSDYELRGRNVDDVIAEKINGCQDGILIIDEFTTRDRSAQAIADLIKHLYESDKYVYTSVVLMGESDRNRTFLHTFNLSDIFPDKFRLNFSTPNANQIGDIFEAYAQIHGNFTLSDKAKSSLVFYFSKLKLIKETKEDLNRRGTMRFPYKERSYIYTSEMFPIYKDVVAIQSDNKKNIDQDDILQTNSYKKLLDDLNRLEQYIRFA